MVKKSSFTHGCVTVFINFYYKNPNKYDWINSINLDTQAGWIQTLTRDQLVGFTKSKAATTFLTNQTNQNNNNTNTNGNDKTKNNNKNQKKPSKKRPHM